MSRSLIVACLVATGIAEASAQRYTCPPEPWTMTQHEALKRDGFKVPDEVERHALARALPACLGHPNPKLRDGIAFEALSAWMRAAQIDHVTMRSLRADLLKMVSDAGRRRICRAFCRAGTQRGCANGSPGSVDVFRGAR
jgi:hypothetical protein